MIITDLMYNGTTQDLIAAGSTTGGTLEYSLDGTNWSEDIPQAKDAGTYQIYYRVSGGKNYEDVAATRLTEEAAIAQRSAEIIADPAQTVVWFSAQSLLYFFGIQRKSTYHQQKTGAGSGATSGRDSVAYFQ